MRRLMAVAATVMAMLLSACASVPMASVQQDAKAKEFTPAPDSAGLYIYRNESFGGAVSMTVWINDTVIGPTAAKTYYKFDVKPGKYKITSHAENESTLSVDTVAGRNYFVWQEVKMGLWKARSLLQQVDEKTGRAGVMESKLIQTGVAGADLAPSGKP